jgi:hypothetical protein
MVTGCDIMTGLVKGQMVIICDVTDPWVLQQEGIS